MVWEEFSDFRRVKWARREPISLSRGSRVEISWVGVGVEKAGSWFGVGSTGGTSCATILENDGAGTLVSLSGMSGFESSWPDTESDLGLCWS